MPRPRSRASWPSVWPATSVRVTTRSRFTYGKSRSSRSSTSVPSHPRSSTSTVRRAVTARTSPSRTRVPGSGSPTTPSRRIRSTKTRRSGTEASISETDLPAAAAEARERPGVPFPVGGADAGLGGGLAGQRDLEVPGLLPEVESEEARRERREVPDQRGRADEVGDRVGDRDLGGHAGPLGGGQRQGMDGLGGGADDGRLGEGPGEQPGGGPGVVAEELRDHHRHEEAGDRHHHGEAEVRERVPPQPAEELGSDLVAGAEEEQVEEDHLHGGIDAPHARAARWRPRPAGSPARSPG